MRETLQIISFKIKNPIIEDKQLKVDLFIRLEVSRDLVNFNLKNNKDSKELYIKMIDPVAQN